MIATQKTIRESIDAVYKSNYELAREKSISKHDRDFISILIKQNEIIVDQLLSMVKP